MSAPGSMKDRSTLMTKAYLEDIIQNMDDTREVPVRKLPFWKNLFRFRDPAQWVIYMIIFAPAGLAFWAAGDGLLFRSLLFMALVLWLALTAAHRREPATELAKYHKVRGNEPLSKEEIQAVNLCARFIYRDMGWYHTLEAGPFCNNAQLAKDPVNDIEFKFLKFYFSDSRAKMLKNDWGLSGRKSTLDMLEKLCLGRQHRTAIINNIDQDGLDRIYKFMTQESEMDPAELHRVIFDDEQEFGVASLAAERKVFSTLKISEKELQTYITEMLQDFGNTQPVLVMGMDLKSKILTYARQLGREIFKSDLKHIYNMPAEAIEYIFKPQGRHGIIPLGWAYDISRGVFVTRSAYMAGYLTKEDAWEQLHNFRMIAAEVFDSWESFFCSEVLGYYAWYSGHSSADESTNAAQQTAQSVLGALKQQFPISNQVDWPESTQESRAMIDGLIAQDGANPFFRPETLEPSLAQQPIPDISAGAGATLH
ncbi:hypothetical protein PsAD2_04584 [Pseudovibrio axinellae]|uniref:DUF1266 domain-containing protein n=2 Tax=Pseudovibrio axinellae TaxID=989403 RepID=A0A161X7Q7_9HYPH|nr:hypothetical protein PsAD2_04584 [Pseudovibrio axinellae]SER65447.1 Protein of unknown function [Pseudovibrio axinellae]